jgi:hypothetical protein
MRPTLALTLVDGLARILPLRGYLRRCTTAQTITPIKTIRSAGTSHPPYALSPIHPQPQALPFIMLPPCARAPLADKSDNVAKAALFNVFMRAPCDSIEAEYAH